MRYVNAGIVWLMLGLVHCSGGDNGGGSGGSSGAASSTGDDASSTGGASSSGDTSGSTSDGSAGTASAGTTSDGSSSSSSSSSSTSDGSTSDASTSAGSTTADTTTGGGATCHHSVGPWSQGGVEQDPVGGCMQACKNASGCNLPVEMVDVSDPCGQICGAACPNLMDSNDRECCDVSFCESDNWCLKILGMGKREACYEGDAMCSPLLCAKNF